ncbi:MAG: hypothetical protein HW374_477, partial [Bacteroidetes bacterium]|nr:hypothetical protein [Bacteroidota bacterium]
ERYSYYWLTTQNELKIAWDNSPHHRKLENFPHHKHTGARNTLSPSPEPTLVQILDEIEKLHIEKVLKKNNWNRVKTAQVLGITPKTLYLKIKRYEIRVGSEEIRN